MGSRLGGAPGWGALFAGVAGLASGAGAVDIVGETQARLAWDAASGPLTGYYVVVSRDAAPPEVEAVSLDAQETVQGAVGETLVVQVAAFGADGVAGPLSPPSEPITFVAAPDPGDPGPGDPPGGDPGPGDPPGGDPGPGDPPPGPARGDFDGDGSADLVVRNGDAVWIWALQGGHVASQIPLPLAPSGAELVGTGDYDGNGEADLLWQHPVSSKRWLWLLSGGVVADSGTLRASGMRRDGWRVGGSGDVDGDGDDDVVLFSRELGEVEIWSLRGASVDGRVRLDGHEGAWSLVAVADTDGDGRAELIWFDEVGRVLERRDPAASAGQVLGELAPTWRVVGAADRDGDGREELIVHEPASGAVQVWALGAQGVAGSAQLPPIAGRYAGSGHHDADASHDPVWGDAPSGAVTLDLAGGPAELDVLFAEGARVAAGGLVPDDGAFRERFCSGDFSGDGRTDASDFLGWLVPCMEGQRTAGCEVTDLDGDGQTAQPDADIFMDRYMGEGCEDL